MNWLQGAWITSTGFMLFAGLLSNQTRLIELGLAGLVGFFVGWLDWRKN